MDLIHLALDFVLHMDVHLNSLVSTLGVWSYVLLFLIIFCETGIVVTPFLPGDSLLFAVGALCAIEGSPLNLPALIVLLSVAAIAGDAANYSIGRAIGPKVFSREDSFWLHKKHLIKAQSFYEVHGGKAIIISRFAPILRTFAPFVAGIGKMSYPRFAAYNVAGGIVWVFSFLIAGNFFGNIPSVKSNFHYVILGIILVSLLPVAVEFLRSRSSKNSLQN